MLRLDVDAVLCISLKEREERRASVLKELEKLNLKVEFLIVDKDSEDPQRGCFNSHKKCSQLALKRGYKRVLVLEDDVVFEQFSSKKIGMINRFLNKRNPEVFYLGIILGKIWLTWDFGIARARGQGAHAVILNEQACKKVSLLQYDGRGVDSVFTKLFKIYTCFPMIAYQHPEEVFESDLDAFRHHNGKDKNYWADVKKKQYISVIKNFFKTLARR